MKTASKVKTLERWQGVADIYKLSEPVEYTIYSETHTTEYVIVSAVEFFDGPETLVFPVSETDILSWVEITGIKEFSHEKALEKLGYTIQP